MDDLTGLDWSKPATSTPKPSPMSMNRSMNSNNNSPFSNASAAAASYSQFRSTPSISPQITNSNRSTPLRSDSPAPGKATDSFSSLLSVAGRKTATPAGMSLMEQQKRMQDEQRRKAEARQREMDMQFGGLDSLGGGSNNRSGSIGGPGAVAGVGGLGLGLGSGSGSGRMNGSPSLTPSAAPKPVQNDTDLFLAFNKDTLVDRSSHYPPPNSGEPSRRGTPMGTRSNNNNNNNNNIGGGEKKVISGNDNMSFDPFDITHLERTPSPAVHANRRQNANTNEGGIGGGGDDDDDNILGLLGRPASTAPKREARTEVAATAAEKKDPRDPAIAELMDMGFSVADAKRALAETDTGLDVRQAIDYLLHEAHGKTNSRRPQQRRTSTDGGVSSSSSGNRKQAQHRERDERANWQQQQQQQQQRGGGGDDKDITAKATEIGGSLLKSANSLWNTGRKQVARAIKDLQDDPNDGRPKWMRDAERDRAQTQSVGPPRTDEAMMLDGDRRPQRDREHRHARHEERDRRAKMARESLEAEGTYISPARRRRAQQQAQQAQPAPAPAQAPAPIVEEGDLLFGGSSTPTSRPTPPKRTQSRTPFVATSIPEVVKKPIPVRAVPPIDPSSLQRSHASRTAGSESFKRGDYPTALQHYTSALNPLPPTHPLIYVVLSNRALTNIKLGDSKAALADCETIIAGIGPSKGDREPVEIDGQSKDLREFWSKAITRRAETLEQLEKWSDAAKAWSVSLENGGGGIASAGKARCEKALAPRAAPPPRPQTTPARMASKRAVPPPSARPASTAASAEAVGRLRAANAEADRVDNEKLALHDSVHDKITSWKDGKENNLRALIASLDNVLWPEANWKKVGMHELVMPNKVKIAYMKGIGKVHPDKIPTTATTEHRMLSAAVFSALNDAWDEFKKQNNL